MYLPCSPRHQCWSDLSSISEHLSAAESNGGASVEAEIESELLRGCVALVERLVAVAHKAAELCLIESHHDLQALAFNYKE